MHAVRCLLVLQQYSANLLEKRSRDRGPPEAASSLAVERERGPQPELGLDTGEKLWGKVRGRQGYWVSENEDTSGNNQIYWEKNVSLYMLEKQTGFPVRRFRGVFLVGMGRRVKYKTQERWWSRFTWYLRQKIWCEDVEPDLTYFPKNVKLSGKNINHNSGKGVKMLRGKKNSCKRF